MILLDVETGTRRVLGSFTPASTRRIKLEGDNYTAMVMMMMVGIMVMVMMVIMVVMVMVMLMMMVMVMMMVTMMMVVVMMVLVVRRQEKRDKERKREGGEERERDRVVQHERRRADCIQQQSIVCGGVPKVGMQRCLKMINCHGGNLWPIS